MIIKKLLKYLKKLEINEMLAVGIFLFIIAISTLMFLEKTYKINNNTPKTEEISSVSVSEKTKSCLILYKKQEEYVENEKLSEKFTFGKNITNNIAPNILSDLDLNFSDTARMFRTAIRNQLYEDGVNFDGKYTIVDVGMTGRGSTTWIVNRTNGRAYEFPYTGLGLSYKKDSNLIILNSKSDIQKLSHYDDGKYNCFSYIEGGRQIMVYEVIPHYFLWENNNLKYLGPKEFTPLTDLFWEDYFKN